MPIFKFIVFPGNNSFVIREALLKRGNWTEVAWDDPTLNYSEIDFIWSPNSLPQRELDKILELQKRCPLKKLIVNHFENNNSLTTKSDMISAMSVFYRKNPEASNLSLGKSKELNKNCFDASIVLSGYNVFHSIPASYVFVVGVTTPDSRDFMIRFNEINKGNFKRCFMPQKQCEKNIWIMKPENLSQGKGIEIFQNLKDIYSFLHYKPAFSKWVIQKYIEKPLLYNGRKFDLRVWVLLTNKGELLVYKDGYLRTSSTKYTVQNFSESIHLTNWSLQKDLNSYEKHEEGNRLPLQEGLEFIFNSQYSKYYVDYDKHIYSRMKDLIIDLVRSCEKEIFSSKKLNNCFELFGFDFIIDEDLRVWLIEANRNPGFGLPTERARQLIDSMVDEMLGIVIDSEFEPKRGSQILKKQFDFIYSMRPSPMNQQQAKNDRRPYNLNVYPIQSIEPEWFNMGEKRFQVVTRLIQDVGGLKQDEGEAQQIQGDNRVQNQAYQLSNSRQSLTMRMTQPTNFRLKQSSTHLRTQSTSLLNELPEPKKINPQNNNPSSVSQKLSISHSSSNLSGLAKPTIIGRRKDNQSTLIGNLSNLNIRSSQVLAIGSALNGLDQYQSIQLPKQQYLPQIKTQLEINKTKSSFQLKGNESPRQETLKKDFGLKPLGVASLTKSAFHLRTISSVPQLTQSQFLSSRQEKQKEKI